MAANFQLQPAETELQKLAERFWLEACNKERELEIAAFEAGGSIRNGDYSLSNLEAIVRWKSERSVHFLIGNSSARIRIALEVAASPESSTREAMGALLELRGIDVPMASVILAAIYPDRYIELDFDDLEALGQSRQDVHFYEEYLDYCRKLAEKITLDPHADAPAPTALHTLDHALSQWSRGRHN